MAECKCTKSEVKMAENLPYFEDITSKMQERRCDLLARQKHLRDKITTMERSVPALMAYNMWTAGQKCRDPPFCKVREIMKQLSPYPDPTEELLKNLRNSVKELNGETEDLHGKIIDADVKLEETSMELESLELANKEMNATLNELEKEVRSHTSPSLHSIQSEDLECLSKIRQLAKQELNLKGCIQDLEKKELIFREHISRLLASKDFQDSSESKGMIRHVPALDDKQRIHCPYKQIMQRTRKKLGQKENDPTHLGVSVSKKIPEQRIKSEQEKEDGQKLEQVGRDKKSSWISSWWKGNQKVNETAIKPKPIKNTVSSIIEENEANIQECTCSLPQSRSARNPMSKQTVSKQSSRSGISGAWKPCGFPGASSTRIAQYPRTCCTILDSPSTIIGQSCSCYYTSPQNISCKKLDSLAKTEMTYSKSPNCGTPSSLDFGSRYPCKPATPFTAPYNLKNPCASRPPLLPCKECIVPPALGRCKSNCKAKCARELSEVACNCGAPSSCSFDKRCQSKAPRNVDLHKKDINSEEEFCECCPCGCEDSDGSLSCNC